MANETVTIPDNLRAKAKEKNWPDDLVQQALAAGATPEQLIGYLDQGITPDQARQFLAARPGAEAAVGNSAQAGPSDELKAKAEKAGWPLELVEQALAMGAAEADLGRYMDMGVSAEQAKQFMAQGGAAQPHLDLSWMTVPTEWNTRARPTKHGLTLQAINIGKYGEVPDVWEHRRADPRRRGHGLLDLPEAGSVERPLRAPLRRSDPAALASRDGRAVDDDRAAAR